MANATNPDQAPVHSVRGGESVPALDVPLSDTECHEDELLSWLQYPLEDSFDKNYCSEEVYPEGENFCHDVHNALSNLTLREGDLSIQHNALSNLTLREATRTWGVPDAKKGGRVLAADMAMAMGAQRAAGLLSQSGADTFNMVRTNAQPHVYQSAHKRISEETSGSSRNVLKDQNPGTPFQRVRRPNFSLFSCTGDVAGMSSEAAYANAKAIQEPKLSSMRHLGVGHPPPFRNQMAMAATSSSRTEQPKIASDTHMTTKELLSMSVPQLNASAGPGSGFSRPSHHNVTLGTSNEILNTAGTMSMLPPSVPSKVEAEAIRLMMHSAAASRALTTQRARRGFPNLSASAPNEASARSSGKRIRAEGEIRHLLAQKDPSIATASTIVADVVSCRQSKLARRGDLPLHNPVNSRVLPSSLDLNNKGQDGHLMRSVSEITTLDSQLHETLERGDASKASSLTALGGSAGERSHEAFPSRTKRKSLSFDDSEIESGYYT